MTGTTKKKKGARGTLSGALPSNGNIVNIATKMQNGNPVIKANTGYFQLAYAKGSSYFMDNKQYVSFVKGVEKIVRTSDEYKNYIGYLANEIGLDHCALMPKIKGGDGVSVEMHHGPILTLYDYCSIIIDSCLARKMKITTFMVAKIVMEEHFANRVQVVMLSRTAHEMVHTGKIFIHPEQAWGDLNGFLEEYKDGLTREQIETINEYIELSRNQRTTDGGALAVGSFKDWNKHGTEMPTEEDDEE